jgi:hypothetical protein
MVIKVTHVLQCTLGAKLLLFIETVFIVINIHSVYFLQKMYAKVMFLKALLVKIGKFILDK